MGEASQKMPMDVEIETLKAKMEALNEVKKGFNERFGVMSEKIGELRYMLVSFGKDIEEGKAASKKAIEMVEGLQPNAIFAALKKSDAKVEILESKVESNEVLMNKVIAEMKEMRKIITQFEGVNKLKDMADELRNSLKEAEKLEVEMKRESQVVKDVFMEIQEKLKEFRVFDERISGMGEEFKRLLKEFDELKAGYMHMAKLEDLERIKANIDAKMKRADMVVESISQEGQKLKEFIQSEKAEKFAENLDHWLKAGVGLEASMNKLKDKVNVLEGLDKELTKRESALEKTVKDAFDKIKKEKDTGDIKRKLDNAAKALDNVKTFEKRSENMQKAMMALDQRLGALENEMKGIQKDIGAGVKRLILKQLQEI